MDEAAPNGAASLCVKTVSDIYYHPVSWANCSMTTRAIFSWP